MGAAPSPRWHRLPCQRHMQKARNCLAHTHVYQGKSGSSAVRKVLHIISKLIAACAFWISATAEKHQKNLPRESPTAYLAATAAYRPPLRRFRRCWPCRHGSPAHRFGWFASGATGACFFSRGQIFPSATSTHVIQGRSQATCQLFKTVVLLDIFAPSTAHALALGQRRVGNLNDGFSQGLWQPWRYC